MFRGVVSSPAFMDRAENGGVHIRSTLTVGDVNYYSLYWDKLIVPQNRLVAIMLPNEEHLLELGLLERPYYDLYNSNEMSKKLPEVQLALIDKLRKENKEQDWSLHNIGFETGLKVVKDELNRDLRISLFNVLPVPDSSVALVDIMEFKDRHKDNLSALHHYLDEVYIQVIKSPDEPLLKAKAYHELKCVIQAINKLGQMEWGFRLKRYNISLGFSSPKDVVQTFMSTLNATVGQESNLSISLGLAQIGLGLLKVTDSNYQALGLGSGAKNLRYLANAYDEGIVKKR